MDFGGTGSLKKRTKSKSDSNKRLDLSQNKSPDVSPSKSAKKKDHRKRRLDDDSEVQDDQPKKSKRVIRIDPHDVSNKRLDDGIVINGEYLSTHPVCNARAVCYYLHYLFILQFAK